LGCDFGHSGKDACRAEWRAETAKGYDSRQQRFSARTEAIVHINLLGRVFCFRFGRCFGRRVVVLGRMREDVLDVGAKKVWCRQARLSA
jgi:hypothetical protein